ncbi:MAG: hypothetical protein GY754_41705 [bacterium]|nr:hypothetical protein [bacterium]
MKEIKIENGIYYINNQKKFFLSADYPYYRDKKENWKDRLITLKEAHIDIITCYIPWRHHLVSHQGQENVVFDFDGRTQGNRDVKSFIRTCSELGLFLSIKPGPFVHAEVTYDGLPALVNPDENKDIEYMLDCDYKKRYTSDPLPAPLNENFKSLVKTWFSAIDNEIIRPNYYPEGNILAVQLFNEGIYSDVKLSPLAYDYSKSSLDLFREMLRQKYIRIANYNQLHAAQYQSFDDIQPPSAWKQPEEPSGVLVYLDWSEYQSYFMKAVYKEYGAYIKTGIPYLVNMHAPLPGEEGLDYWLTRVQPEIWNNVHYGFTNWTGAVSYDDVAFNRYLTLIKRKRGPNLEENWGFSKMYDSRYKYPVIPCYQTILTVANGATGFNVYTGVRTESWDNNVDTIQEKPYPDCSPVTEKGEVTHKYRVLQLLNSYLREFGEEILNSKTTKAVSYLLYLPYSYLASWCSDKKEWEKLGVHPPRCGLKGLDAFQHTVRSRNYDFNLLNLQALSVEELLQNPVVTLVGGFFMDELSQKKLLEYVKQGGTLILLREVPEYNDTLTPCTILKDELFSYIEKERVCFIGGNLFENNNDVSSVFIDLLDRIVHDYDVISTSSETQAWCHYCNDIRHLFVLSRSGEAMTHALQVKNNSGGYDAVKIRLPEKSAAIIRIENNEVTAYFAKGINEYENSSETVEIWLNDHAYTNEQPGDVLYIKKNENIERVLIPADAVLNIPN